MGALVHPFLLAQGRFLILSGAMLALYGDLDLSGEVAFLFRDRTEE